MGREAWNRIKQSKWFYIQGYRRAGRWIVVSIGINFLLGLVVYYTYVTRPAPDFYATSGVVPPIKLTALAAPNYSATALLEDDPVSDNNVKVIPE